MYRKDTNGHWHGTFSGDGKDFVTFTLVMKTNSTASIIPFEKKCHYLAIKARASDRGATLFKQQHSAH